MHELRIPTAELSFAALEAGPASGRTVLLLHGFPDTPRSFGPLMQLLAARGFRCVAPWMRGYAGTGPAPSGDYSLAALADDVDALLDSLGVDDAIVVGHDWGAAASLSAAAAARPRFSALLAASVPPIATMASAFVTSPAQLYRSRYMLAMQLPGAARRLRAENFAWVRRLWLEWSPSLNPPEDLIEATRAALEPAGCAESAVSYYRGLLGRDVPADGYARTLGLAFGRTRVPTLLVHGAQDGCIGAEAYRAALRWLPEGSSLVRLPTAGHFVQVEAPSALAALVCRLAESS